ncbi:MAG: DUF2147 domain-containing protein [Geminicoccaceae bacterium]
MRTLAIVAAALLAGAAPAARAASAEGEWVTEGDKARVAIAPCAGNAGQLCGTITWSYRPADAPPGELRDINNTDPKLRDRPIVGLPLLQGFSADGPGAWSGGTIYDPEGGKTYKSKLRLGGDDTLKVDGCVLFLCQTQTWTRYRG